MAENRPYRLSRMQKTRMALGLMAVFYPILLIINVKPENWGAELVSQIPLFAIEYLAGALNALCWIGLAERIQEQLEKWFGADALGFGRPLLNVTFLLVFLGAGSVISIAGVSVVVWLTKDVFQLGNHIFQESDEYFSHGIRAGMALFSIMALMIYLILLNRHIMLRTKAMQDKNEQLEKEQVLAQFSSLKNQINPHFLFNSLSILSSLVRVDADLSERFIDQLSRSYRYILEQKDRELVSLRTELDFIASYAFLLKIRFAEKFFLHLNVPELLQDHYKIAPLTLQLLVENAVKHNRMSSRQPLQVKICLEEDFLIVRNPLQPRSGPVLSTGIGLQNIINRYALFTNKPVWAGETEECFIVKVPLLH